MLVAITPPGVNTGANLFSPATSLLASNWTWWQRKRQREQQQQEGGTHSVASLSSNNNKLLTRHNKLLEPQPLGSRL